MADIKILDVDKFTHGMTPVTNTEFHTKTGEYHDSGLFSEKIFGVEGSLDRSKSFSYMNLNTKVIHPVAYRILIRLDRKLEKLFSTEQPFIIEENGSLKADNNGIVGLNAFREIFPKIKFRGDTPVREKLITTLQDSYKNKTLFIDKLPIIPPDLRPIFQDENGMWLIDELNNIYVSILRKSFQIKSAGKSGALYDLLNFGVQKAINEHDKFIKTKIGKKRGLIRGSLLGKRVDYSGRAVITPGPQLDVNEVGLPLRMAVSLFDPFIKHYFLFSKIFKKKDELEKEIQAFTGVDLSVDSVQRVIKAIKSGDTIPPKLRKMFFDATEIVMMNRVVLAKRDPVLHDSSYRACTPVLIEGDTVQLCTLTVGGYNADFDGDSSILSINYTVNDSIKKCHISNLGKKENFILTKKYTKSNKIIVTKYKPTKKLFINSIDPNTGKTKNKEILEYSKHENIEMYKIHDIKNRFEDFWSSYDHSLIIYDEIKNKIRKISPKELLKNPKGKFLLKDKNCG